MSEKNFLSLEFRDGFVIEYSSGTFLLMQKLTPNSKLFNYKNAHEIALKNCSGVSGAKNGTQQC